LKTAKDLAVEGEKSNIVALLEKYVNSILQNVFHSSLFQECLVFQYFQIFSAYLSLSSRRSKSQGLSRLEMILAMSPFFDKPCKGRKCWISQVHLRISVLKLLS
jgi:hypothetical protein